MKKQNTATNKISISSGMDKYVLPMIVASVILVVVPMFTQSAYILTLGSLILIYSILAISVDLLSCMGLTSLGHAGFFAFAAYGVGNLTVKQGLSAELAVLITIFLTVLLAMLFGFLTNKVWGNTYLMVNLALGQSIWGLAFRLDVITMGEVGLIGIKRPTWFGINFSNNVTFYYFLFIVFILVFFFVYRFMESPFGITVRGIKQSSKRMSALGYGIYKHKFITYVISGTLAGIAGILFCFFFRIVTPTNAHSVTSSKAFLMSLVGGSGTLIGAVIGATAVVLLENFVSAFTERWLSILGALYVITVMFSPRGVMGTYSMIRARLSERKNVDKGSENTVSAGGDKNE